VEETTSTGVVMWYMKARPENLVIDLQRSLARRVSLGWHIHGVDAGYKSNHMRSSYYGDRRVLCQWVEVVYQFVVTPVKGL